MSLAEDFMVWNFTKDEITVRMAAVEEETWAPPLNGEAQLPGKNDQRNYSDATGVPVENMTNSDFIAEGRWDGVDEALRGVYKEASDVLGQEFVYPCDEK